MRIDSSLIWPKRIAQAISLESFGVTGKPGMPDQPEQHYFCEFYHMLLFGSALHQFMFTDYISELLVRVLSRNRAINFVAEDIDIYS